MKLLTLIRGKSGSGKSYLAEALFFSTESVQYSADDYFTGPNGGDYSFNAKMLPKAHEQCRNNVSHAMADGFAHIIIHNTFTQKWEMQPYIDLAKEYGYAVQTIIVDADCFENVHNVPAETVAKQKARFEY